MYAGGARSKPVTTGWTSDKSYPAFGDLIGPQC